MLLRIVRGRVLPGREDDFVAVSRRQVSEGAGSHGLLAFMAGYRRVDREDQFVLVSTWQAHEDVVRVVGDDPLRHPRSRQVLEGIAEIESVEQYALLEPIHRGILDAPGAVLRVTEATIRPGRRADLLAWLARKSRELGAMRSLLGWAMATRGTEDGAERAIGVSAWPSPLLIEAIGEAGREGMALFSEVDQFITDQSSRQYQAIELRLPERVRSLGGRRLIAARFGSGIAAERARSALSRSFSTARESGVSIAGLGGGPHNGESQVLVARVMLAEYLPAERLIADHGGQVIYERDEAPA